MTIEVELKYCCGDKIMPKHFQLELRYKTQWHANRKVVVWLSRLITNFLVQMPGWIPGQSMCDLWRTDCHWNFVEVLSFLPVLIIPPVFHTRILLQEGRWIFTSNYTLLIYLKEV